MNTATSDLFTSHTHSCYGSHKVLCK